MKFFSIINLKIVIIFKCYEWTYWLWRVDHILIDPGLIDVSMVVTDIHGCKDTMHYDNMYRINDVVADLV